MGVGEGEKRKGVGGGRCERMEVGGRSGGFLYYGSVGTVCWPVE
jgi:hypothetical protein